MGLIPLKYHVLQEAVVQPSNFTVVAVPRLARFGRDDWFNIEGSENSLTLLGVARGVCGVEFPRPGW